MRLLKMFMFLAIMSLGIQGCGGGGGGSSTPTNGSGTTTTFSTGDLAGTWHFYQFIADSTNSYWARATFTINGTGLASFTDGSNSTGSTGQTGSWQLAVSTDGTVTYPADTTTKLFMSKDKKQIIGTGGAPDDKSLYIMVKAGSGFQQSDLQGAWKFNGLTLKGTSSSANPYKWQRSDASINNTGTLANTNLSESIGAVTQSLGQSSFNLALNAQGLLTVVGLPNFHGVLSADKNLIVAVNTNSDGTVGISLYTRTDGTTFTTVDLQGAWRTNMLSLKDFYWGRALTTYNASGVGSFTQIIQSNGTRPDLSLQFSLASNGVMTSSEWGAEGGVQTFGGIMSTDKNMMIGTLTQDRVANPSPTFVIWIK